MASENPDDQKELDPARDGSEKLNKLYKGVHWIRSTGKWCAQCGMVDVKQRYIGSYDTDIEAALAYDKRAWELHGVYADLNFLKFMHRYPLVVCGVHLQEVKGRKENRLLSLSQKFIEPVHIMKLRKNNLLKPHRTLVNFVLMKIHCQLLNLHCQ